MIRMQRILSKITFLVGNEDTILNAGTVPVKGLFSYRAVAFSERLAEYLLHDKEARAYTDVQALAFWLRKGSLEKERAVYRKHDNRLGKGVVFHVAPSNIPVQFVVSLMYALLAGNISWVRISEKEYEQVSVICAAINRILDGEFFDLKPYICIMRYPRDDEINAYLSSRCDARMIWGGDDTVEAFKRMRTQPRCTDICFANRYSIAVINADDLLALDIVTVATDFYYDTYYSDQNACSSTRLVIWFGKNIKDAKEQFWEAVEKVVAEKYTMSPISSSDKLLTTAVCAANFPGVKEVKVNNYLVRLQLPHLESDIMRHMGNCGYFFEYEATDIVDIVPLMKRECQTITYLGNVEDELNDIVRKKGVRGVDRIVKMGHSMDLSFIWDGLDLPLALSRVINNK